MSLIVFLQDYSSLFGGYANIFQNFDWTDFEALKWCKLNQFAW